MVQPHFRQLVPEWPKCVACKQWHTEDGGRLAVSALRGTALWLRARVPARQVGNHAAADAGGAQVEPEPREFVEAAAKY
jgi:hypothetical protein